MPVVHRADPCGDGLGSRVGGFLTGGVATALVQSSSAVSAILVTFVDAGAIGFGERLAALLASLHLSPGAKATAWANFLFNLTGVLLYLPFLHWFADWVHQRTSGPAMTVASAHLIFNLTVALLFLLFLGRIARVL